MGGDDSVGIADDAADDGDGFFLAVTGPAGTAQHEFLVGFEDQQLAENRMGAENGVLGRGIDPKQKGNQPTV